MLFTADWCHACKKINTLYDNIQEKFGRNINFKKINIDDEMFESITLQYKIVSIPTLIITENGHIKDYLTNPSEDTFKELSKTCSLEDSKGLNLS